MLKYAVVAAALMISATPALAEGQARIEIRGGIAWAGGGGGSEATGGLAAGYDFDLGEAGGVFAGVEVSADKILVDSTPVTFGGTARIGTHITENGRLFAAGGYTIDDEGDDALHFGAGYEHNFTASMYGKVEYRHFAVSNFPDIDTAVIGIGWRF